MLSLIRSHLRPQLLTFTAALVASSAAMAATAPHSERAAIEAFTGCYEVTFDFVETFPLQKNYQTKSPYHTTGVEYIVVDQNEPARIGLQHILTAGGQVIKHWRQDWLYEHASVFDFKGNDTWVKRTLTSDEAAGNWVQRVLQVDDSPRYECSAPWIQWGSSNYWECETWSPLPRREHTKRSDYNVLNRRNRQMITKDGWVHEEDNTKLVVNGSDVKGLVKEKGENRYRRIDDKYCAEAADYWTENKSVWNAINAAWTKIYDSETRIEMKSSEGKPRLSSELFDLADRAAQAKTPATEIERQAEALIRGYL